MITCTFDAKSPCCANTAWAVAASAAIRVCRHSSECDASGGAVDGGGEARIGFIVTGSDAPKLLEPLKAVLDEMPPFVHLKIVWDGSFPISLGGDDGDCTAFVQCGAQTVVVKGFVGNERGEIDILDQRLGTDAVVALTRQEHKASKISQRIGERYNFGRQPAARMANRLIESPPFAPVPCRWTLTIVPSMKAYSKSGSPDSSLKSLSKTPLSA
jgi:hypothetical protein